MLYASNPVLMFCKMAIQQGLSVVLRMSIEYPGNICYTNSYGSHGVEILWNMDIMSVYWLGGVGKIRVKVIGFSSRV